MEEKNKNQILDGTSLANDIKSSLVRKIAKLDRQPGLAAILVGGDIASAMYIRLKERSCKEVGIEFHKYLCGGNDSSAHFPL